MFRRLALLVLLAAVASAAVPSPQVAGKKSAGSKASGQKDDRKKDDRKKNDRQKNGRQEDAKPLEGLITLRAYDDQSFSFDFDLGLHATSIVDGELILDEAEIVFDRLTSGMLSVGFRNRELVRIVDLGNTVISPVANVRDVAPKPEASIFSTLTADGGRFYYQAPVNKRLRNQAAERVFDDFPPEMVQHIAPRLGHVYVMRWRPPQGTAERVEHLVKFQVVSLIEGQSVTLRWVLL